MQVPKPLAASFLAGCALVLVFTSQVSQTIMFGHFFLLICAFGAWFVGNRFALLLGAFLVSIQTMNGRASSLNDDPIIMAMQFCSVLAVILMLGVSRAALEIEWRFARVDPLTGALNRKAFFEAVENDRARESTTVLVFLDIDGLKSRNDRLGHEAGDQSLRDFAERVSKAIRKEDVFARIGGDEFAIFLKVQNTAAAGIFAHRLNSLLNLDRQSAETSLSCSLGVLVLPSGSKSIDAELAQADALMYQAKRKRVGLMIAMSTEDETEACTSITSGAVLAVEQRATWRSTERFTERPARRETLQEVNQGSIAGNNRNRG